MKHPTLGLPKAFYLKSSQYFLKSSKCKEAFSQEKTHVLKCSAVRILQINAMVYTFTRNNKKNKIPFLYPSPFQQLSLRYKYIFICVFVNPQFAPFLTPIGSVDFSLCFTWEKERYQISRADKDRALWCSDENWFRSQTVKYLSSSSSEWVFNCWYNPRKQALMIMLAFNYHKSSMVKQLSLLFLAKI